MYLGFSCQSLHITLYFSAMSWSVISVTSSLDSPSFVALSCNDCCKTQATLVLSSCRKQIFFPSFFYVLLTWRERYIYLRLSFLHYPIMVCLYHTTKLPCPRHITNQHNLISPPLCCLVTIMFNFDRPKALRCLFHICTTLVFVQQH